MIVEYHRPKTLDEALRLLGRSDPATYPMGGGTVLSRFTPEACAVVDLQALDLNHILRHSERLRIGSCATLASLAQSPLTPTALKEAIYLEASHNIRQMATIGGALVSADGRSPLATALLALDATMTWLPNETEVTLASWLSKRVRGPERLLMTEVAIPLDVEFGCEGVGRTPLDRPVVYVGVAKWPSGRIRIALGGHGDWPTLAMDAMDIGGAEQAVRDAFRDSDDAWASGPYRQHCASVILNRLLP